MNLLHHHLKTIDTNSIWKVVKDTKVSFVSSRQSRYSPSYYYYYYYKYDLNWNCQSTDTIISDYDIEEIMKKILRQLNVGENDLTASKIHVKKDILEIAANMFTYLISCPKNQKLIGLYKDIFESSSQKEIILAINSIQRYATNSEKEYARQIWNRMKEILNLNFYDNIKIISEIKDKIGNNTKFYKKCTQEDSQTEEECKIFINILGIDVLK